jgi:hypothetical protein
VLRWGVREVQQLSASIWTFTRPACATQWLVEVLAGCSPLKSPKILSFRANEQTKKMAESSIGAFAAKRTLSIRFNQHAADFG